MEEKEKRKKVCVVCVYIHVYTHRASLVAQLEKNPPAMQETPVQFLVGNIPWRRDRLPTPVFLPGEFPWTEEPCEL